LVIWALDFLGNVLAVRRSRRGRLSARVGGERQGSGGGADQQTSRPTAGAFAIG
jgi:hypothetical protein